LMISTSSTLSKFSSAGWRSGGGGRLNKTLQKKLLTFKFGLSL